MRNPMDTLGPASESLRLAENYRQMSDDELIDLAQHPSELTDMAQGILAQEISSRKLKVPPPEDQLSQGRLAAREDAQDSESAYEEDRELVHLCTVWSRRDAEQLQNRLLDAGIPFCIGPEKVASVDEVRSNFADGLDLLVMRVAMNSALTALKYYDPQDEPDELKDTESEELAIHCPKCHSTDVVFEHSDGIDPEDKDEDDTITQKFDWECAACGYKWEDQGIVSKS
jgi:DNA-directed RNA polymerase subunit M/transcription elongation factor TFIIS